MFTLFETLSYEDKLKFCNLNTLHYRCLRGDMIETYKILSKLLIKELK